VLLARRKASAQAEGLGGPPAAEQGGQRKGDEGESGGGFQQHQQPRGADQEATAPYQWDGACPPTDALPVVRKHTHPHGCGPHGFDRVWHGAREWSLNDGQISNTRVVRVALDTGYNPREGNRRASRNGRVSDLPPEIPLPLRFATFASLYAGGPQRKILC
jgi:hypothetical protein